LTNIGLNCDGFASGFLNQLNRLFSPNLINITNYDLSSGLC